MAAPGTALNADWKIVTRTGDTSIVEYFKGGTGARGLPARIHLHFGFRSPP
jgi:hypothetical protein